VTNCAAMTDIVSEADLKARLTDLSSNGGANFVMAGSVAAELTDGAKVTVTVMRLVSKVILKKISTDWVSAAYRTRKFTVNSIYMTNVAGECNFAADAIPAKWYNKLVHEDASLDALLYRETKAVIANKGSYSTVQSFYVYPNPVDESSSSGTWSPRRTMLVLDCTLGEERMYYPVEMPVIGRNKTYTIDEILITRKGSDNPWEPVIIGESAVGVTVSDWELGLNIDKVTF